MTRLPAPRKHIVAGDGPNIFVATGDDPQMVWEVGKDRPDLIGVGAVRVRVQFRALAGELTQPCLYADWGAAFSEDSLAALTPVSEGVFAAVLHSNGGALRRLRFDPSTSPCVFELAAFGVEAADGVSLPTLSPVRRMARAALQWLPAAGQARARRGIQALRRRLRWSIVRDGLTRTIHDPWRANYARSLEIARNRRSPDFAAPPLHAPARRRDEARVVAFYLPQFHPIPENDAWWGKGFTEWSNVAKAVPQFAGHLQPRLPADFGFYDLRTPEVQRAQTDLARRFGVDAFCFHYYWFAGRRLLERPLDAFVADPALDFPFALCWANENWTRRWDGNEADVLIGQDHSEADDLAVLDDLARYMRSPRYLRVEDRPLLIVYRPAALPDARATVARWRTRAREIGIGELYLACTDAFGFADFRGLGFDALVEFPPHGLARGEMTDDVMRLNPSFAGRVYDYERVADFKVTALNLAEDPGRKPGVMPMWDNEARKPGAGHVFHKASPAAFARWFRAALEFSEKAPPDERLVFVNAWNEWAEGTYLEPDRWYGHAFGQAVRSVILSRAPRLPAEAGRAEPTGQRAASRAVALVHIYYSDMIDLFASRLRSVDEAMDLAITFPDTWSEAEAAALREAFPRARLSPAENRGRDLGPFARDLAWARSRGYDVFLKLHSKRSPHMGSGEAWRDALLDDLLTDVDATLERFAAMPRLGLLAPARSRMELTAPDVMADNRAGLATIQRALGLPERVDGAFAAGSMFWGRIDAFAALSSAELAFEPEMGRIDGTLAHALERAIGQIVDSAGYASDWSL